MSHENDIPKNGKYNEFVSQGNKDKTQYTVLDGTDLADIFVNRDKLSTKKEENTSNNARKFLTDIQLEKNGDEVNLKYNTDTTFPNCVTNGPPNCINCPTSLQKGSETNNGHIVTRFINKLSVVKQGNTFYIKVTTAPSWPNCNINGGYCTYCDAHCNCVCEGWWCSEGRSREWYLDRVGQFYEEHVYYDWFPFCLCPGYCSWDCGGGSNDTMYYCAQIHDPYTACSRCYQDYGYNLSKGIWCIPYNSSTPADQSGRNWFDYNQGRWVVCKCM